MTTFVSLLLSVWLQLLSSNMSPVLDFKALTVTATSAAASWDSLLVPCLSLRLSLAFAVALMFELDLWLHRSVCRHLPGDFYTIGKFIFPVGRSLTCMQLAKVAWDNLKVL